MTHIVIINPNSTVSMTTAMVAVARAAAPDLEFVGWTSHQGPPAIQGAEDGEAATPPLLDLVMKAAGEGAGGIVIGCFDDTGLAEAAQLADCPVIGIGQAAYHFAALRQWRFSVVTTLRVSVPIIEGNIRSVGFGAHLGRVRASDAAVLELESDPVASTRKIVGQAECAAQDDGIDAIILGCAGMVQVSEAVRERVNVEVIDPVVCAARCFTWLNGALA
ncbi:aspartate/glutamate racemase family protein [Tateyamaria sp. SN3-11]|uniref:aspartate/glutamate racemase family protein n=1 Tax=Tateyamaria sp. SN3-11 TaxID=3092147 RepID=UPI0039EBAFCE